VTAGHRPAGNGADLLAVDELVVRYGPITAVRRVSLRVEKGEIVALLGANGAGKSSLLNAVAGLVPVAEGRVLFRGEPVQRLPPERIVARGLALTPEGRRVFPRLSVDVNLRLGGATQRDREALRATRKRVLELFPILAERLSQDAGTLSGGEQQMLAIGRSLMAAPALLMLDEPSLGLAPQVVDRIFELMERLRDSGTTILLVEQNVDRALRVADRAYVLKGGAVEAQGAADALRRSAEIERAYLGIGVSE
jgi:branched-chain amino acid transport system ATP-binding protein